MRLLVTGGSGFLGGYVLDEAARRGHSCVALARSPAAVRTVAARGAVPLAGDLDDGAVLPATSARAGCDALLNLASLGSGLSWTILRPTMIYGAAGDRSLSRLPGLLARLPHVPLPRGVPRVVPVPGGGRQLQQPVHVADLAEAVLAAVERPEATGHDYDVAGPEPLTFAELLHVSAAAVGCRIRLVPVPMAPVAALTRGYERVSRRPGVRAEQWQRLAEDKAFGIEAAARDLDYAPRSFAEGIRAEAAALGLTRTPPAAAPQAPASPGPSSPTLTRRSHA